MNIHAMITPCISIVNPSQEVTIRTSTGYTVDVAGNQTPLYTETVSMAQIQPLSDKDLQHVNGLNLGGESRAFWFNEKIEGLMRTTQTGGAILIWNNQKWYVTQVAEPWGDLTGWTKVIATLQLDAVTVTNDYND